VYRRLHLDLTRLVPLVTRGLSDRAIGRVLGCSRETVFNYRQRLGIASSWRARRHGRAAIRARHAELDRLWGRLSLEEKVGLLLQHPLTMNQEGLCERNINRVNDWS
jgi:hypothetical protein